MRWRESYKRPEPILNSGEPREQIEVEARYELITPLGLRAVAEVMGSPEFRADKGMWNLDTEGLAGRALEAAYGFLAGDGVIPLARACAFLLEALALQDGAERVMPGHVEGSPGFECLPPAGMRALAMAAAELAGKIGPYTRERVGYPASPLVGEAIGGMFAWLDDEEGQGGSIYLGRAALDLMDAIHALKRWPELQAATLRGPGCTPPIYGCARKREEEKIPVEKPSVGEVILGEWKFDGDMQVTWEPGKDRPEEKAKTAEVTRMTLKWEPWKESPGA